MPNFDTHSYYYADHLASSPYDGAWVLLSGQCDVQVRHCDTPEELIAAMKAIAPLHEWEARANAKDIDSNGSGYHLPRGGCKP